MRAAKKSAPAPLPTSHLEALDAAGFEVLSWRTVSAEVQCADGAIRKEWLPRHCVNWNTHQFIEFSHADDNAYGFDGYSAQLDRTHGGTYRDVQGALGWFVWLERNKK